MWQEWTVTMRVVYETDKTDKPEPQLSIPKMLEKLKVVTDGLKVTTISISRVN